MNKIVTHQAQRKIDIKIDYEAVTAIIIAFIAICYLAWHLMSKTLAEYRTSLKKKGR